MAGADTTAGGFENKQSQSNRGGRRQGAGRKPGSATLRTRQKANEIAASGEITPLDYMLQTLRDENLSHDERMDAAKSAAPYVHARLAAVNVGGQDGNPIQSVTRIMLEAVFPQ